MQVSSSALNVSVNYASISYTNGRSPAQAVGKVQIPPATQALLNYIADSTKLSGSEKKSFIQTLAEIDAAGGGADLLKAVMAAVTLAESIQSDSTGDPMSRDAASKLYKDTAKALQPSSFPASGAASSGASAAASSAGAAPSSESVTVFSFSLDVENVSVSSGYNLFA